MNKLISELIQRDLVKQSSNIILLEKLLNDGKSVYCGFDPTSDSLHVGSLLPLITLARFAKYTNVIPLIGGATGMIGDPSFKAQERQLQDEQTLNHNKEQLSTQLSKFYNDKVLDNYDWMKDITLLSFLRDFGKYFSVNQMINKDSVRSRIIRNDVGISFTEFSYQLLQSYDFLHLYETSNCAIQIGGSDQWGNMTSGMDLIHKHIGNDAEVAVLTMPLLLKSDGTKFGKSEKGTVWLSPEKTSAYDFYQFWLGLTDPDVHMYYKMLSMKSIEEINAIFEEDKLLPKPKSTKLLAMELTEFVHGKQALISVLKITDVLFNGDFSTMTDVEYSTLVRWGMQSYKITDFNIVNILVSTGLAKSKTEARTFLKSNSVKVEGEIVNTECDIDFNSYSIIQRGKKEFRLLQRSYK